MLSNVHRRVRGHVEVRLRDHRRKRLGAVCMAPYGNLYLGTGGEVRACCVSSHHLGNIRVQRLPEIWNGVQQAELRRRLRAGDLSYGCSFCAWEHERGLSPYARLYDTLDVRSPAPAFPVRMEFAMTNACNLQCTMCTGELSSSIRLHRDRRPPIPKAYDDRFFADLEEFVPHLRFANFVGGEPFLGVENFRVWDLMARLGRDDLAVDVTTNGTQWGPRVEEVLERLRPAVQVSVDGATRSTFESIRVGADFDEVMANIERFLAHARSVGTPVDLSHCLMPQNHQELGDLLLYAEARGMRVMVGLVTTPADHAIERLDAVELGEVLASLEAQAERVLPQLRGHNATAMVEQVERLRSWAEQRHDQAPAATIDYERVLGLPRMAPVASAAGPTGSGDPEGVVARRLDQPHRVLTVGRDDIILDCSPAAATWLEIEPAALIGVHVVRLEEAMSRRFGRLLPAVVEKRPSAEVVERTFTAAPWVAAAPLAEVQLRTIGVAVRDAAGWIDHVALAIGHPVG